METPHVEGLLSRVRLLFVRSVPDLFFSSYILGLGSLNDSRQLFRCGVANVGGEKVDDTLRENDQQLGAPIEHFPDAKAVRAKLLASLKHLTDSSASPIHSNSDSNAHLIGPLTNYSGYFNPEGGWAEAARAMQILLLRVKAVGGRVIEDQEVTGLVKDESGQTRGVRCRSGTCFEGDRVILTIGAWTASTFPDLELDSKCLATGYAGYC